MVVPSADAAAGGWADGGPVGAYYANPSLAGDPAFTRRDVRVDFQWGEHLPVGGSPALPYRAFPRDRFTVRWTGRVVARFSEAYVFACTADDGARLKLKPTGAADWVTAIEQWGQAGTARSQPVQLEAGKPCDVVLEYREDAGPAAVSLAWSCPSAPEQVIDPVVAQGLNASSWEGYCWADEAKSSRFSKGEQDERGDPTGDCTLLAGEGRMGNDGTYELSFQGQAEVARRGSVLSAGEQTWKDVAPRGAGWDATTNTTRLRLTNGQVEGPWYIEFKQTARDGKDARGDGVGDLCLLRPLKAGADAAHRPDEIVYRPFKDAVAPFTCLRWLQIANQKCDGLWSSRTLPCRREFTRGGFWSDNSGGECWEYLIVLANECGKDLYVCLPMQADDAYIEPFARLARYGSDGATPYEHEVDDPRWPPLNPNLRLYVEIGNEIWNWGFGSTKDCNERATREIKDQTEDGKLIDYDGHGNYRRWHALRTVRASDVFRRAFGDAAMGARIRLLMEYQYNNAQETAWHSFSFLDAWFNNGDGEHVVQPHPVRHWVWGAGGATYYGVGNADGRQDEVKIADAGFDAGAVPAGTESAAPAGSGWTCTGDAAIYRNWLVSIAAFSPGKPGKVARATAAGCSLTVEQSVVVRALGCWLRPHTGAHNLVLMGPQGPLVQVGVQPQRIAVSEVESWVWAWGAVPGDPVRLEPGVTYHLLARAEKGEPNLCSEPVPVVAGPGFAITGAARVAANAGDDPKAWTVETAAPGAVAFGPLALRASATGEAKPTDLPEPSRGGQAAVLRAGGALSTKLTFAKPGRYALELHAAGPGKGWPGYLPFSISVGGKSANPHGQRDERVAPDNVVIGGFHRRISNLDETWGSAVFSVEQPGEVELRISAAAKGEGWTVLDEIAVTSVDALMESGFGAGQAYGQVAQDDYARQLDGQAGYARSFGLPVIAYEAGWSLGGDFHAKPIHTWAKFKEDRALGMNDTAADIFMHSGGFMNVWGVYGYWPPHDLANAVDYPLWCSIAGLASRLPAEETNGIAAPCRLEPKDVVRWSWSDNGFAGAFGKRGEWRSWLARVPASGVWTFAVKTQGEGGWELELDGVRVGAGAAGAEPIPVRLVRGLHGVRLRAAGAFTLSGIEIQNQP
ncbi:MAG: hypothetical protein A3K19_10490 [Lentisphaerae bacterium RIFOXYB12_FULL_65_16]|nr:MAG: hypothetical protein A3K18_33045 [Lentisphaerae bacterium RIFOXYA12_64_32]OGV87937.1 MAG: hypothetical protein A3K19_10490 [Lentisphaerae bacterium RIFOXYB12_FULL_65_16]